jgi:cell division protein FtsB
MLSKFKITNAISQLNQKSFWRKVRKTVVNPYVWISAFFIVWMIFFDKYNAFRRISDYSDLQKLKSEQNYYKNQIKEINQRQKDLMSDTKALERFAREHYYMKKDSEEVFVIENVKE